MLCKLEYQPCIPARGTRVPAGRDWLHEINRLHSRKHNEEVQLCAFDILTIGDEDLRKLPLHLRKNHLSRLLARRPEGIMVSGFEQGEIGPELFRQACKFGLEGLVSKRRDSVYRGAGPRTGSR